MNDDYEYFRRELDISAIVNAMIVPGKLRDRIIEMCNDSATAHLIYALGSSSIESIMTQRRTISRNRIELIRTTLNKWRAQIDPNNIDAPLVMIIDIITEDDETMFYLFGIYDPVGTIIVNPDICDGVTFRQLDIASWELTIQDPTCLWTPEEQERHTRRRASE